MLHQTKIADKDQDGTTWRIFAGRAILIFVLCNCFYWAQQPFQPGMPSNSLDGSWVTVLGEGAARGWQWGERLVFTYGPASTLNTNYYTGLYPYLNLLATLIISIVIGTCAGLLIWRDERGWPGNLAAALVVALGVTLMVISRDTFHFACALVVFFLGFRSVEIGRLGTAAAVGGAAALGVLAMSKTTLVICAIALLATADVNRIVHRRWPLLTPVFLLATLLTYLALGQSLAALPRFLLLQAEIVRGYGEAMSSRGGYGELALFLLISTWLGKSVLQIERAGAANRTAALAAVLLVAGFATSWLLAFKAGFTRQDLHTLTAWQTVGIGAILYALSHAWPRERAQRRALFGMLATGIAMVAVIAPVRDALEHRPYRIARLGEIYRNALLQNPVRHWSGIAAYLSDPSGWQAKVEAEKERAWTGIRGSLPLPKLAGRVDIIPSEQTAVIANGLDYDPRPIFQEYSTYTSRLVEANRDHFRGAHAPDWLIFAPGSIDGRYPSSAEGALWPDFLAAYEPASLGRNLLFLHRRSQPLPDLLGPAQHLDARIGEPVSVAGSGPVFAKLTMRRTVLGHILNLLYHPPEVTMVVTTKGGAELDYRLIPEIAATGFLLSPHVATVRGYLAVALGATDALDDERIATFRIVLSAWGRLAYSSKIDAELITMNVEALRQSGGANPLRGEIDVQANLAHILVNSGTKPSATFRIINEGIFAHPPVRIGLDIPPGAENLTLGFGLQDFTWQFGRTNGVCFRVTGTAAAEPALFERCLRPLTDGNDRGDQTATLDLKGVREKRLWLETTCANDCAWDWAYWSKIELK
jgi:hypothetical protein